MTTKTLQVSPLPDPKLPDPIVIAIDGPAASGKGTLAKHLAKELSFAHMDTGALYRLIALKILEHNIRPHQEDDIVRIAETVKEHFSVSDLDNPKIRTDDVGSTASKIAGIPKLRQLLLDLQRDFSTGHYNPEAQGVVMDGRDIGTVICPSATIKFFVTADVNTRARRRFDELSAKGISVNFDDVLADMTARDERDSNRAQAPMKPADDAVIIDTTILSAENVIKTAMFHIAPHLKNMA